MSTYSRLAEVPLEVGGYELDRLEQPISSAFTRVTTVVRLAGGGEEGVGEDVTYTAALHPPPTGLDLAGTHTIASFSGLVGRLDLFDVQPDQKAYRDYRRWAFESAALDLALRQAGISLAEALGREPRPVRFVVSMRLGEPSSAQPLRRLLERYPGMRFKLDPAADWDAALVSELAELGVVDSVDLKGAYRGTPVDLAPDAELYERVALAFPEAWIEDPALNEDTNRVLEPHRDRITWDAPIHAVADIEALPFPPRMLNVKPSRFGSLRALFDAYDYCADHGIEVYGGGQFELGPGRGHIQYLASLFHPDAPNDVAPGGYNHPDPPDDLPVSPLEPAPAPVGFRWGRL